MRPVDVDAVNRSFPGPARCVRRAGIVFASRPVAVVPKDMRCVPSSLVTVVACSVVVGAFASVVACAVDSSVVRDLIAPDFSHVDDTRLQDSMWRLGNGVQQLSDVLAPEAALADDERRTQVLSILDVMGEAAATVNRPGQKRAHQNIAMNIDKLIGDIAAAKAAAAANDLDPARALPATCLACHTGGGGGAQK
jgi:hypothetical protein